MKNKIILSLAVTLISLTSSASMAMGHGKSNAEHGEGKEHIKFTDHKSHQIINNKGEEIGSIKINEASHGVIINIDAKSLPSGKHGMHFHEVADCSDLEGFKTTKGHIMPAGKPHGFLNSEGPHAGNLPNLVVNENGTVSVELYSNIVKFSNSETALYDADGSALIIHENEDDHFTQPIGGSGGRIGCAEIK